MLDRIRYLDAETLDRRTYLEDFYRVFKSDISRFDKLERGQSFQEPGYDSWEAFHRGDWSTALSLLEASRTSLAEYYEETSRRGLTSRRLRVVEHPVTPYLQWEMHILRLRAELGESIRVLGAETLQDIEDRGSPLPELVILGDSTLYEVVYDDSGVGNGARRFTDPALVEAAAAEFSTFFDRGENLLDFFAREIAPLPPPTR